MFEFEAFAVLKTKEFTNVNDCFQDKSNEEIGHYGQTLTGIVSTILVKGLFFAGISVILFCQGVKVSRKLFKERFT